MSEHQEWIRYHSFRQAIKCNKNDDVDKLIENAKKISSYIFEKKKVGNITLVDINKNKEKK